MSTITDLNSLGKRIGTVLLFVASVVIFAFIFKAIINDFSLWFLGTEIDGVVEESILEKTGEKNGEWIFTYGVRYSFTTPDGDFYEGVSSLGAHEWSGLKEGGTIPVVYFPLNPSHNRLDDSQYIPLLLCAYIPFMILSWFGLVSGWRMIVAEFKRIETYPWTPKEELN